MLKHIQTIRRQDPTNSLSVFDNSVVLTLKELRFLVWWPGANTGFKFGWGKLVTRIWDTKIAQTA